MATLPLATSVAFQDIPQTPPGVRISAAQSPTADRDYPQLPGDRGLIEPAPRRVRGYFGQELVFDTTRARYVWGIAYYPQYYIPVSDVRMVHLQDQNHVQKLQFGSSRLYSLTSAERTWKFAARVYDSGPVAGSVRFEWDALDWFEEDEPLILHPRNPLRARRRAALPPSPQGRVRRRGTGRDAQPSLAFRNRSADALLYRPHRRRLLALGAQAVQARVLGRAQLAHEVRDRSAQRSVVSTTRNRAWPAIIRW
jgi:uncharacterized protein (DUF427 family)